jgi:hypothetical protein
MQLAVRCGKAGRAAQIEAGADAVRCAVRCPVKVSDRLGPLRPCWNLACGQRSQPGSQPCLVVAPLRPAGLVTLLPFLLVSPVSGSRMINGQGIPVRGLRPDQGITLGEFPYPWPLSGILWCITKRESELLVKSGRQPRQLTGPVCCVRTRPSPARSRARRTCPGV